MAVIPPDGQVPVEPVRLPCSNPVECAEVDEMVADNRWLEWHYKGTKTGQGSSSSSTSSAPIEVAGYDGQMYCAWLHHLNGSWPPPPTLAVLASNPNAKPSNCVEIISKPTP